MGDLYPLWASPTLSDEERAQLRERIERAPAHVSSPPQETSLRIEALQLAIDVERELARRRLPHDPELQAALSELRDAALGTFDPGLEAAVLDLREVARRNLPLLRLVARLSPPSRSRAELVLATSPAHRAFWDIGKARRRGAAVLFIAGLALRHNLVPRGTLPERLECLEVTLRSQDAENVTWAIEAVEEAIADASHPTEPDLPPVAELRLPLPR